MQQLTEQEIIRREKLQQLRQMGIEPYPAAEFEVNTNTQEIKDKYEDGKKVKLAGRLMSVRIMGKASFAELQDSEGRVQIYVSRDDVSSTEEAVEYNTVFKKLLDIGDFIGIEGYLFKTQVGEISVHVTKFTLLSKTLRPLPVVKTDEDGKVHDAFVDRNYVTVCVM